MHRPSTRILWVLWLCSLVQPAAADFVRHFSTANSAQGVRGQGAISHHGLIHSKNRAHYYLSSVFHDSTVPGEVIALATNGDQTFDVVTGEEVPEADTHEILIGRSSDGETFSWERVVKTTGGLRLAGIRMAPVGPGRPGVWAGVTTLWENRPNDTNERFIGVTDIEIDYGQRIFRLPADATSWRSYPFGAEDPFTVQGVLRLPYRSYGFGRERSFGSLARIDAPGGSRLELWSSLLNSNPTARDLSTCDDATAYQSNITTWSNPIRGVTLQWHDFDPSRGIGQRIGTGNQIQSSVRALPSDHARTDMQPVRAQMTFGGQTKDFLYVGTQDSVVCRQAVGRSTGGATVRYIELVWDPQAGTYRETLIRDLLDISDPQNPGFTCLDSSAHCSSSRWSHYSYVSAHPVQIGGRLRIYANNWAGVLPTFPIIGQVGQIQVGMSPKRVELGRTYREPVVFIQPPSWEGGEPVIARITQVTANSFTVKLQEAPNQAPGHPQETLSYMVMEKGTYRLRDRRVLEVDKVVTGVTIPSTLSWISTLDLHDGALQSSGAVALTQLQSGGDPSYAKTRHLAQPAVVSCPAGADCVPGSRVASVRFGIEKDEASLRAGVSHGTETVGVLLVGETWLGRHSSVFKLGPWGAEGFVVGRAPAVPGVAFNGTRWTPVPFERPFPAADPLHPDCHLQPSHPNCRLHPLNDPVLLAWPETRRGGDPVELRYHRKGTNNSLTPEGVELATDEDVSFDSERAHTAESVAFMAIGRNGSPSGHWIRGQEVDPENDLIQSDSGVLSCSPPSSTGLLGHWDFENGSDLGHDSSTAGRHGTAFGSPALAPGRIRPDGSTESALALDGSSYLSLPSLGFNFSGQQAITVEAWVRVDSHRQTNIFRSQQPVTLHSDRFAISNYVQGSGWSSVDAASGTGTWYHLVGVFQGGTQKLYVDGQLLASKLNAFTGLQGAFYSEWALGARIPGAGGPDQHFVGWIDDVKIYDRALGPGEIMDAALDCGSR